VRLRLLRSSRHDPARFSDAARVEVWQPDAVQPQDAALRRGAGALQDGRRAAQVHGRPGLDGAIVPAPTSVGSQGVAPAQAGS
jgi:hypothetical protein